MMASFPGSRQFQEDVREDPIFPLRRSRIIMSSTRSVVIVSCSVMQGAYRKNSKYCQHLTEK